MKTRTISKKRKAVVVLEHLMLTTAIMVAAGYAADALIQQHQEAVAELSQLKVVPHPPQKQQPPQQPRNTPQPTPTFDPLPAPSLTDADLRFTP